MGLPLLDLCREFREAVSRFLLGLREGLEWGRSNLLSLPLRSVLRGDTVAQDVRLWSLLGGNNMARLRSGRAYECVIVDVNTQYDFCDRAGAFPVANTKELIPALRRVIAWTKRNHAPVVSSVESHRPSELSDNGHPSYCVDGTEGQRKIDFTVFPLRVIVEVDNTCAVPDDLFHHWQQVLFRKRTEDLLTNPKADCLLTRLPVEEYILFGTGLERSVKTLAIALLIREKAVTVIGDACGYWHKPAADLALRQMAAKGARLISVEQLMTRKLARRHRYRGNGSDGLHPPLNGRLGNGRVGSGRRIDATGAGRVERSGGGPLSDYHI